MVEPLKIYHCLSLCKNTYRKDLSFIKKTFLILIQIDSIFIRELKLIYYFLYVLTYYKEKKLS